MTRRLRVGVTGAVVLASIGLMAAACTGSPSGTPAGTNAGANGGTVAPSTPAATRRLVWAAPTNPMERTLAAGLQPETSEHLEYHVHAHLDVFIDGQPVLVPAGIGINTQDPDVHTFAEADGSSSYGGIQVCGVPCISPLHTHFQSGIIHTESATPEPNMLGQLFTEWGVELSASCVGELCTPEKPIAFYVNGEPYTDDPTAIELADRAEIAVVIGTPPATIPATADFTQE
ncbi:MAG TPA: hypothetical protein VFP56_04950 [Candidatus Limnocylindrales bacterium]|nr:hypothetical protein [Candidatus Limnocylindrales bacterium]